MDSNLRFVLRYWLPPFAWATVIFLLSSLHALPTPPLPEGFPADKIAHAAVYALFGALLFRAFARGEGLSVGTAAFLAILFGAAYGLSDEVHQAFVPGRACEGADLVADIAGVVVATALFAWFQARRTG